MECPRSETGQDGVPQSYGRTTRDPITREVHDGSRTSQGRCRDVRNVSDVWRTGGDPVGKPVYGPFGGVGSRGGQTSREGGRDHGGRDSRGLTPCRIGW